MNAFVPGLERWKRRCERAIDPEAPESEMGPYGPLLDQIAEVGNAIRGETDAELKKRMARMRGTAAELRKDAPFAAEAYAVVGELCIRCLGQTPYRVQTLAALGLHAGKVVEMQTGEGKTLAAVLAASLLALHGRTVHVLTFNDYLARRDATFARPLFDALGLQVGMVERQTTNEARRIAYARDVVYVTAKEAGFDFLRDGLALRPEQPVQGRLDCVIVDEADSILIDEARVPLVIAGARRHSGVDLTRIVSAVRALTQGVHWEADEPGRNVQLTEAGAHQMELLLGCTGLYEPGNETILAEVNQALHAQVLLRQNVDYVVQDGRIGLVDEFTGRVVADRRWPDGLQAALEAKEGLAIQPGGRILGSITMQHFVARYRHLSGMTGTACTAASELHALYRKRVMKVPPHRPCLREDREDVVFANRGAKERAIVEAVERLHRQRRPVLIGTMHVEESERLASELARAGIPCQVLNAKQDEREAAIIAEAGALGAVTLSTNMAGRGADIRLGGATEQSRDAVVALGGLFVLGTNRHESRRIDDQLRGRAGRQGDPGTTQFFVSLEDHLMVRFGIRRLIPSQLRPPANDRPLTHPVIRREVNRLQRIVEGQNQDMRSTLNRYTAIVERQRATLADYRSQLLTSNSDLIADLTCGDVQGDGDDAIPPAVLNERDRIAALIRIDECWAEHLQFVAALRDGIHLVSLGGRDPLQEFHKQVAPRFQEMHEEINRRIRADLCRSKATESAAGNAEPIGPSSTWTYLINDRAAEDIFRMFHGPGSGAMAFGAMLNWPLVLGWACWSKWKDRRSRGSAAESAGP